MDIHKFFDEQIITASKLPKERQRFTYDDLIAFAKVYAAEVNKNCNLHNVSKSFTAEFVVNELEQCDTLDDAIMSFKQQM